MNQSAIDIKHPMAQVEMDIFPPCVEITTTMREIVSQMCTGTIPGIAQEHPVSTPVSYVLVVEDETLVGILTERDVLRLSLEGVSFDQLLAKDCMTHDLITLRQHDIRDPSSVKEVMTRHKIRHLPILDMQDRIVGVVTAEKLRLSMRSHDFLQLRKVSEVMARAVITASPHETVLELTRRMFDCRVSCIVIVEKSETVPDKLHPIGIITERDVVQMQNMRLDPAKLRASESMSHPLFCISPQQNLLEIQQKMQEMRVRRFVVAEANHLVGIVTQTSMLSFLDPAELCATIRLLQSEVEQLKTEREGYLHQRNLQLTEAALEAEQRFEAIFNNTFQFTGLMTTEGILLEANQTALDFGGLKREDVVHRLFWETYWWSTSSEIQQELKQAIHQSAQGEFIRYEVEVLGQNKQKLWIDFSIRPLRDASGQVVLLIPEGRDISQLKQSESQLQTTQARLLEAQQIAHLGSWELDLEQNSLHWSETMYRIFERNPLQFEGTYEAFLATIYPDDRDAVDQAYHFAIETHIPFQMTHRLLMTDGRIKYVQEQCQTFYNDAGKPLRSIGTVQDITNLTVTEQALQRQRDFNQLIAEITSRFVDIDAKDLHVEINRTLQMIGEISQSQESYLFKCDFATRTFSMTHEWISLDRSYQLSETQNIPMDAFPWSMQQLLQRRPLNISSVDHLPTEALIDQTSWAKLNVKAVLCVPLVRDSEVSGFLGFADLNKSMTWDTESVRLLQVIATTIADAQERIAHIQERFENEERLRLALNATNQGLYDLNIQTGEAVVGPEYATMLGYDPDGFQETNTKWLERLHPEDQDDISQLYQDYVTGLRPDYKVEFRQRTQSGDWKWILSLGKIVAWDETDQPLRMLGTHTDISDRKAAELQLTLQNGILARIAKAEPLPHILEAIVHGTEPQLKGGRCSILLCDSDGVLHLGAAPHLPVAYNQAVEGTSIGEGVGSCGTAAFRKEIVIVSDIETDPLWQDFVPIALENNLRACWSVPVRANDGHVLATFAVYYPEIHHPEPWEIDVIQFVADITKVAIESEQSRQALYQLNRDLEANVIARTAELQASETRLRDLFDNATDLIQSVAPDGKILFVNRAWQRALGYPPEEVEQLSMFDVIHPDEHAHCQQVMQKLFEGEIFNGVETRFISKTGQVIILEGNINCQFQGGRAIATRGIFRDVTDRKRAEETIRQTVAQLEATNQELESFSYSVSHDLRSPLRHINGFINALRQQLVDHEALNDEKVVRYLEKVEDSSQKMAFLIDNLLKLSRIGRQSMTFKPVSLRPIVEEAINLLEGNSESPSTTEFIIGPLPTIQADASLLKHVFSNLIHNAVKFSRSTPHPQIEINTTDDGTIFIRDNGVGFDMRYADKLFGAFQRLHSQTDFEGTGIGLAIVQRIIHRHGGQIWAESALDQGTTFFFTLGST